MYDHPQPRRAPAPSPISHLLEIARRGLPFTSVEGQVFFRIPLPSGGFAILPVREPACRDWFFATYYAEYDSLPSIHAFSRLLAHLEAQASADPDCQRLKVFRRVGARGQSVHPDQILLDLANSDGQFVEISGSGWQVSVGVNALLQTSRAALDIPVPLRCPDNPAAPLETLRAGLNLATRADWLRCLAWLLAALRPTGPFPILVLQGPPASGKTFAARLLRTLIDPAAASVLPPPHNPRHLLSLARYQWILAFDHVAALSPALCDAFCRLSHGVGATVRQCPSSDAAREPLQDYYRRPVLFTVTENWSPPPDLAGRILTVNLPPLPATRCRPEPDLLAVLADAYPKIIGALCTAVSAALSRISQVRLTGATHNATALAWAMAAAPALGCTAEELQQAWVPPPPANLPLLSAIGGLLDPAGKWSGTAAELLPQLPPSSLYRSPKGLSQYLKTNTPALTAAGLVLNFRRSNGKRFIALDPNRSAASSENDPKNAALGLV